MEAQLNKALLKIMFLNDVFHLHILIITWYSFEDDGETLGGKKIYLKVSGIAFKSVSSCEYVCTLL